jgi:hypothetical protein
MCLAEDRICAFQCRIVDGGKRQRAGALDQVLRVLEQRTRPLHRRQQLGNPDAAVAVGIDQLQSPAVELQPLGGAAQGGPQLLVELSQSHQVGPGFQPYLIETA